MATPVRLKADGSGYEWEGLPGRAIGALVRSLSASRARNKTRFATETEELSDALSRLCGVRFETMPQPVEFSLEPLKTRQASTRGELVTIGSFGPPREEKGSHLLLGAILLLLNRKSHGVRFIMQWTEDFECEDGSLAQIPAQLRSSERFRAITDYFKPGEYEKLLTEIDAIVLPYGSSYALRGSRVVIDALVRGLPVAVTAGTSMQTLAESYGKCVLIKAWDIPSIATALDELVRLVRATKESADQTAQEAREYFSVAEFRRRWLAGGL
jgi:glycosyltransferase involved in cell wall biosynthesis